jgi:hypothetical protein
MDISIIKRNSFNKYNKGDFMIQDTLTALENGVNTLKNEVTAFGQEQYDKGFADGSAAGNGKLYSEDEKNQFVASAIAQLKADLLAQYAAAQVAETVAETGFVDLLK